MGTFLGHLVPGSFFLLFALWWTYNIFHRYHTALRVSKGRGGRIKESGGTYRSTAIFPSSCCRRCPLEGYVKVAAAVVGMIGELVTAFKDGKFVNLGNGQHMTMFFFFALNGIMDISCHHGLPVLPPDMDYVSAVLAFLVEGLLFYYHLHNRDPMDVQVHMLLFYVIICCAVSTLAELYNRKHVLPALCRTYFTLLQGTWFIQVGFLLYPPFGLAPWDTKSHSQMLIVTLIFCWHNAVILVFMLGVGALVFCRVKHEAAASSYQGVHGLRDLAKLDAEQVRHIIASDSEVEETV